MEEGRSYYPKKKGILILDRRFPIYDTLNIGDKGQATIGGVIDSERMETLPDGTENIVKTIYINTIIQDVNKQETRRI